MRLTVCMSPCTDLTIEVDSLNVGKTNVVKSRSFALGGKGINVAVGIKRLGGDVYTTGVMYQENGHLFEEALHREEIPFTFVWNKGRARENLKIIDGRAMMTEINDVGAAVEEETTEAVLRQVEMLSAKSNVTVLSGGLPRGLDEGYYGLLAKAVNQRSLKIVDAVGQRMFSALNVGVDLVKPNLEELENAIGKQIESKEDMLAGCYELLDRGAKRVMLSLGKQGAVITDGRLTYYGKSLNVAVNSTVGAGDSMVAAAALQLEQDADLYDILRHGVAAGTARVMSMSRLSFTKEKYEEVLNNLIISEI